MGLPIINQHELKPGDILLCIHDHPAFYEYMKALVTYVRLINATDPEKVKERNKAYAMLIRGLITYFDRDQYFHASFWDGEKVAEAGSSNGVSRNPIDHYKGIKTDVYRFAKDEKPVIGTPDFPFEPLRKVSDFITSQNLKYSYTTAVLIMFLCLSRWKRDEWIQKIEDMIKAHLSEWQKPIVEAWFKRNQKKLRAVIELMVTEAIRTVLKFRQEKGMVCSEFVAAVFNEAEPVPKYHIEKPMLLMATNDQTMTLLQTESMDESVLDELESALNEVEMPVLLKSAAEEHFELTAIDILYTPADLAHSINTIKSAHLVVV